ncbi:MAG: hypothetical protein KF754_06780 [Planctomycetes bacterium]|nr:hypothetical protein [Planctomycetota bacterium]
MNLRAALMIGLLVLAGSLAAQEADDQARRILEQRPFKGYRIDKPRPSQTWEGDGEAGRGRGSGSGAPRRSTRASSPQRGSEGESRSDSSGSGPDFGFLSSLGSIIEGFVWVVLAIAALAGLVFLVKALVGLRLSRRKKVEKSRRKPATQAVPETPAQGKPDAVAPEFEDALARAAREYEQALQTGEFGRAAVIAYRMFWLRAGWQGCVEEADVRTWRDALRMVRAADVRQGVGDSLQLVERVRYGDHRPGRAEFEQWRQGLDRLNPQEALR